MFNQTSARNMCKGIEYKLTMVWFVALLTLGLAGEATEDPNPVTVPGIHQSDLITVATVEREDYSYQYSFDVTNLTGKGEDDEDQILPSAENRAFLRKPKTFGPSRRLTEFLKAQHDKSAPPDGFLHVDYEIELVHILEIDEVKQIMKTMVYVEEKWTDLTLAWEPEEFGNLTQTWLPEEDVWLPDILIFNMVYHNNLLHSVRAPVTLLHNGTVIYSFPAVYGIMCQIDIANFPLDTQHCALEVASWEYGIRKLQLDVTTTHMLEHYTPNEEWDVLHVNISYDKYHHEDFYVSEIFYNIHLQRKPLFYVFSLILPSLIICSISVVGLFAPFSSTGEREERFTLGVTAILTMAVLSLMVSEKVPHSSKNVPLLVGFFMFEMTMVTIATGVTAFVMWVHRKDIKCEQPPPTWIQRIFRIGKWDRRIRMESMRRRKVRIFGSIIPSMFVKTVSVAQTGTGDVKRKPSRPNLGPEVAQISLHQNGTVPNNDIHGSASSLDPDMTGMLTRLLVVLQSLQDSMKKPSETANRHRRFDQTVGAENDYLWIQLGNRLDSIFMIIFLSVLILPAVYIMMQGQFLSRRGA